MKNTSTKLVYAHWNDRRGRRPAPDRGEIDPGAIRHALGDTFILAADFIEHLRFRLAGTRVCALFCRELKGEDFGSLWSDVSRETVGNLITVAKNENIGAVAGVTGRTDDGDRLELEMLLLPLAQGGPVRVRALGALTASEQPYWLGEKPLAELTLETLRHIGPPLGTVASPALTPAASDGGRLRPHFVIYNGGRAIPDEEERG